VIYYQIVNIYTQLNGVGSGVTAEDQQFPCDRRKARLFGDLVTRTFSLNFIKLYEKIK